MLFDLGVSSMQLDVRERGFAYAEDAPLDMRMDQTTGLTAADVVNSYPAEELARILRAYGEEKFARRIAEAIVRERRARAASPRPAAWSSWSATRSRHRPDAPADTRPSEPSRRCASRSTTSWRRWRRALPAALDALGVGGRVVVLSYHSLEDRLTKQAFAERDPQRRAAGPPGRARGQRAGVPAAHPGAEKATEAEIAAEPARRLGAAAGRGAHQHDPRGSGMSQPVSNQLAQRSRVPRIAEAAVERARLTVVPRGVTRAPRVPFVALVSLLLVSGVAGLLLFNTSMQQASFHATALEQQAQILAAEEQSLQMELEMLRDPQRVAAEARAIGMVPPANPAFIRLSDGRVLGTPTPAVPEDGIRIAPLPTLKPQEPPPGPGHRARARDGRRRQGRRQGRRRPQRPRP